MSFIHLHTHSHYSIGRAVPSVRDLVRRAADLKMPALALTDNNSIAGIGELTVEAEKAGIHPIIGCELDVLPSTHGIYQGRTHRITLLVESEQGYRNLVALITKAHSRPDLPPHVSFNDLLRQSQGLIVLTGTPRSELYFWLREGRAAETKEYLNRLAAGVGAENLYFEILEYPHERTRTVMDYVQELSRFLHIPAVVTQNVHFLDPEDMLAYCALTQFTHGSPPRWPLRDDEMPTRHFTTPLEMERRFAFHPELLEESEKIAQRCAFKFPRKRTRVPLPQFDRGQDPPSVLWDRAIRGATSRYGALTESLKDRLNLEYSDIRASGSNQVDLAESLLLMQDITSFLKEMGLCRGVGRGKLLSSVIAYALEIIEVDPLAYNLDYQPLREAPDRLPVFQLEVSSEGSAKVLEYLNERFGKGNIAAVGKRIDWGRQRLFRQLCRWAGLPAVNLRKFTPEKRFPVRVEPEPADDSLADARMDLYESNTDEEVEPSSEDGATRVTLLGEERIPRDKSLQEHQHLADAVYALHPCPRGFEAERAHYVLSKEPVGSVIPVESLSPGEQLSQADATLLDRLQMPRLQFTSFSMLNILETAQHWIRQEENPHFVFAEIPLHDEATFKLLGFGLTNGIAPIHGITAKSLLRSHRPQSITQLLRINANAGKRHPNDQDPNPVDSLPDCILSYWCAYLKVHHPVSFMTAMLSNAFLSTSFATDQRPTFQILLRETRKMNIEVLPLHINFSSYQFSQEGNKIRPGLMLVQGVGRKTFDEISEVRQGMPFSSLADFCHRTDMKSVPHATVANLIKAGAFDAINPNRTRLLVDLERALKRARRLGPSGSTPGSDSQLQLFDPSMFEMEKESGFAKQDEKTYPQPSRREIMRYEREAVGYAISHDLLDYYEDLMRAMRAISPFEIGPRLEGKTVYVAGFIDHIEREGSLIDQETEMILDMEGCVVKIPSGLGVSVARILNAQGPVLIEGTVKRSQSEYFLMAQRIYQLDEVARQADEVSTLRLDLQGENRHTLRILRSALKPFKGNTRIEIENFNGFSLWSRRSLQTMGIFYCPPLYQTIRRVLPESQITLLNADGEAIRR